MSVHATARTLPARRPPHRCGGSVYLLVLATSVLVATLGISGLMAARLVRVSAVLSADASAAESLAAAGLAAAANRLGRDEAFAASPGSGWSAPITLGEGVFRTRIEAVPDSTGLHSVRVRAVVGDAVRVLQAEVREPVRLGPELLANGGFGSGLFPTTAGGDAELTLRREGDVPLRGNEQPPDSANDDLHGR